MIVLIFISVTAAIFLFEKLFLKNKLTKTKSVKKLTITAMCGAFAAVLMLFEIPLFFAPSFYKLDFSEIPVLFCGFALGPFSGAVCELLKILLHLLMKGTSTAFVGELSNFLIGVCFVVPASFVYTASKSKRTAVLGLIAGSLAMTVIGSILNAYYLIPQYIRLFRMSEEAILAMAQAVNPAITSIGTLIMFAVVPFNLLKAVLDSVTVLLLYKNVKKMIL